MNEETVIPAAGNPPSAVSENSIWLSDALRSKDDSKSDDETGKTKISLVRAFKERSRLIRQIQQLHTLLREENSILEGGVRSIDIRQTYAECTRLNGKLIGLKQAISRANSGIIEKLVELAELKTTCFQLKRLPVKEGKQEVSSYDETKTEIWISELKKAELTAELDALQARMDWLQDEIDEFNARTLIEFES
ncbi:MAG: hypothetical protein J5806_11570 [Lentisphaeria bacterium]|nr:hypothetical protein [Lentisphaeria bacterium]